MFDLSCQGVFFRAFINLKTVGAEIERGRVGVGRNRNNYTLLRSMKELSHMKPKALYNFISKNIKEELTPQNFPIYQKKFNWLENPFNENERILKENNF